MKTQDSFTLSLDNGVDEIVLVIEIVIHLRLARAGRSKNVVKANSRDASFVNNVRCGVDDSLTSPTALARQWS